MSKKTVYIVSGSSQQRRTKKTMDAKELYDSPLFIACKAYLEAKSVPWLIFSHFHGLLWPDATIAPYNPLDMSNKEVKERIDNSLNFRELYFLIVSTIGYTEDVVRSQDEREKFLKEFQFKLVGESQYLEYVSTKLLSLGIDAHHTKIGFEEL